MRVKYRSPILGIRGSRGIKNRGGHGFTRCRSGTNVLQKRTDKRPAASDAEKSGQRSMGQMMHTFSNLTDSQRDSWHRLRMAIKHEWRRTKQEGPEQWYPKEITWSDLDFFISCNHHRVLGGETEILTATMDLRRPQITIDYCEYGHGQPFTLILHLRYDDTEANGVTLWACTAPPFASQQRYAREHEFYGAGTPLRSSFFEIVPGQGRYVIEGNRYPYSLNRNYEIRLSPHNRANVPYAWITWRGLVPEEPD